MDKEPWEIDSSNKGFYQQKSNSEILLPSQANDNPS